MIFRFPFTGGDSIPIPAPARLDIPTAVVSLEDSEDNVLTVSEGSTSISDSECDASSGSDDSKLSTSSCDSSSELTISPACSYGVWDSLSDMDE